MSVHYLCTYLYTHIHIVACILRWEGSGENEVGRDKATGIIRVTVDPKYYRPTEVVCATYFLTISFIH